MSTQNVSTRKKVLVADKLAPEGLAVLKARADLDVVVATGLKGDALKAAVADVHAIVVRSATHIDADVMAAAPRLAVVGRAGVGVDNVDVQAATQRGVLVMNTPGGSAVTTGEHALALLFALCRQVPQATASMRGGKWEKSKFMGREISGKTLGIVGVGNIGRVVAERARGLHMRVLAYDPFLSKEVATPLGIEVVALPELLARADFVTVHAPLTADTKGLLGASAFAQMKKGAMVINCARGGIVDEHALAEALRSGHLGGAALDVFESEPPGPSALFELPNFICTPHLGASTDEAQVAVSVAIAEQIIAYLSHGTVQNSVNFPALTREQLAVLGPYLTLCEKMGALLSQLDAGPFTELRAEFHGAIARYDVATLTSAALTGLLSRSFSTGAANAVNARTIAQARGLRVVESRTDMARDYATLVCLTIQGPTGPRTVEGTLFGEHDVRIVRLDQFRLEVLPQGHAIVVQNADQPGVIGAIGTRLGQRGINVSRMQLGLDRGSGEALAVWSVDSVPPPSLAEELAQLPNTRSVRFVEFGELPAAGSLVG